MPESGVSYAGREPPVMVGGPMPADLYRRLAEYAPTQTGGDLWALILRCVRREMDPDEARRLEMLAEQEWGA